MLNVIYQFKKHLLLSTITRFSFGFEWEEKIRRSLQ